MKKIIVSILVLLLIGVTAMNIFKPRSNSSPYASEQNALEDLSGWYEDSPDRTWTFVSANAGGNMFTVYVSGDVTNIFRVTMRVRAKQGGDYLYFIVHSVSSYDSGNDRTTLMLFGGTDYDLASASITDVAFSKERFPVGFSIDEDAWAVEVVDTSLRQQSSPVSGTWYNLGSMQISIPVGHWRVSYKVAAGAGLNLLSTNVYVTLSTANNTESNSDMTTFLNVGIGSAYSLLVEGTLSASDDVIVASETSYYLNAKTGISGVPDISFGGATTPTRIRAVSAYY